MKEIIIFLCGALAAFCIISMRERNSHEFHYVYDGARGISDADMKEDTVTLFLDPEGGEVRYKQVDGKHVEVYKVDTRPKPDSILVRRKEIDSIGKVEGGPPESFIISEWMFGPRVIDSFYLNRRMYKDTLFFAGWRISELSAIASDRNYYDSVKTQANMRKVIDFAITHSKKNTSIKSKKWHHQ